MVINGIRLSQEKLDELIEKVGSRETLEHLYSDCGGTDAEIAEKTGVSTSWICKLRKIYGIKTPCDYLSKRNKRRFVRLSDYQMEFLVGSLFGDSCIAMNKMSGGCFWICRHSTKQEDYLLKKADIMKNVLAKITRGERAFKKGEKKFPYVGARSFTTMEFSKLRSQFYPNGVKSLKEELFRRLTGRSFAFWFFDDGSCSGSGFDITTFDPEFKNPKYISLFKEVLDLDVSIRFKGSEGKIHVLKSSHDKAWSYIEPEMVDSMWHKIPWKYRKGYQQPSREGNFLEGSTTGGSLNSDSEHGDNTRFQEQS